MIYALNGKLLEKRPNVAVIDVTGVAFETNISLNTYSMLPDEGCQCMLFTHMASREDGVFLYGFANMEEKKLFLLLTTVSGIGPKLALKILSGIGTSELQKAVASSDHSLLSTIPGVGKKTAERIIVELKDKFEGLEFSGKMSGSIFDDVAGALVNLGYKLPDCKKALENPPTDANFENLLKFALNNLAKK